MSHLEIRGFKNLNENAEEYRTIQKSSSSFSCLEFYRSIGGSETLRKVAALLSKRRHPLQEQYILRKRMQGRHFLRGPLLRDFRFSA